MTIIPQMHNGVLTDDKRPSSSSTSSLELIAICKPLIFSVYTSMKHDGCEPAYPVYTCTVAYYKKMFLNRGVLNILCTSALKFFEPHLNAFKSYPFLC